MGATRVGAFPSQRKRGIGNEQRICVRGKREGKEGQKNGERKEGRRKEGKQSDAAVLRPSNEAGRYGVEWW